LTHFKFHLHVRFGGPIHISLRFWCVLNSPRIERVLNYVFVLLGREAGAESLLPGEEREQQRVREVPLLHWPHQSRPGTLSGVYTMA